MNLAILRNAIRAFTLIELLVVVAIIGVMVAMLAPHHHGHRKAYGVMCMSNLRQVGIGYVMWASEHQDKLPWQVSTNLGGSMELVPNGTAAGHFLTLSNYLKDPRTLWCPTDKARSRAETFLGFGNSNLSYFTALVTLTNGAFAVLGGERHLQLAGKPAKPGLLSTTNFVSSGWTRELHPQTSAATGRLLFLDGHVESVESERLPAVLQRQPFVTNQFVIP